MSFKKRIDEVLKKGEKILKDWEQFVKELKEIRDEYFDDFPSEDGV
ncbi:MAG: hypothetical protein NWF13_00380 [Candidatus Bathyarchaeota archaeon]|jgi:hypothetical protein|nr:hypothetical protein [Candidatus Bathyarchaeota archaeon]